MRKLYIAGPDVFMAADKLDAHIEAQREFLKDLGFEGLFPCDNEVRPSNSVKSDASWIAIANMRMIERCDAVIANLSPFRGPGCDQGTAMEVGYALGRGKRVYAYTNDAREYRARMNELTSSAKYQEWMAPYPSVESFGLFENLMLATMLAAPVCDCFKEAVLQYALYAQRDDLTPKDNEKACGD